MSKNKTKVEFLEEHSIPTGEGRFSIGLNDMQKAMQAYADQEKRSTAIAFLDAVSEDGCSNYFRKGDEWFLGDPEEEEDAEGPFTTAQIYDLYINSL